MAKQRENELMKLGEEKFKQERVVSSRTQQ
jgi:hypothetical protein